MKEEKVIRLHPDLAKKYMEANPYYGRPEERSKVWRMMDTAMKKQMEESKSGCRWTVWVYVKFECPNLILEAVNRLHSWWPSLAEGLIHLANTECLSGIYLFVVREEGDRTLVDDFMRI